MHISVGSVVKKSREIELKQAWEERDMVCFQQARAESVLTAQRGEVNSDAEAFDERDPCSLKAGPGTCIETVSFCSLRRLNQVITMTEAVQATVALKLRRRGKTSCVSKRRPSQVLALKTRCCTHYVEPLLLSELNFLREEYLRNVDMPLPLPGIGVVASWI